MITQLSSPTLEAYANCPFADDAPRDINVVLVGGPDDFPDAARHRQAGSSDEKVKVPYRSGYEHFERTAAHYHIGGTCRGIIYRWTTRTRIAE